MRCLTMTEALEWQRSAGVRPGDADASLSTRFCQASCNLTMSLPAAQTHFIARVLTGWLVERDSPSILLVVTETGIWPSSENAPLFAAWRRGLGVHESVDAFPAQEFARQDLPDAVSLVQLVVVFGWEMLGVNSDGSRAWTLDHECKVVAMAREQAWADACTRSLRG